MAETFAADFADANTPSAPNADGSTFSEQELEQALLVESRATPTAPPGMAPPGPAPAAQPPASPADNAAVDRLISALDQRMQQGQPAQADDRQLPPTDAPTGLTPNIETRLQELFPSAPPAAIQTPEQQTQLSLYRTGVAMRELFNDVEHGATLTKSENDARQAFSAEVVGEGWDYGSVVTNYVTPTLQQSPELQAAVRSFDNPGNLLYFLGTAAKLSSEYGGDPARAARAIAGALKRPVDAARDLVGVAQQANRQPALTPTESGQTAGGLMDIFQRAISNGDDAEFERLDKIISNQPNNNDFV
jgi:hypothetical protein